MNRSLINRNKSLSNSRIYSDTVSLNLYKMPSNNFDDSRSVCIRNNKRNSNENLKTSKLTSSRILRNLSISQKNNSINKTQNKTLFRRTKSQPNLTQSLVKPPKQALKPVNSIQQKPACKQGLISNNKSNLNKIQNTSNIQKKMSNT